MLKDLKQNELRMDMLFFWRRLPQTQITINWGSWWPLKICQTCFFKPVLLALGESANLKSISTSCHLEFSLHPRKWTNIPEKEPFQKEISSSNPWIFRKYVSFSGGYCISLAMKFKDASSIIPSAFKKLLNLQKNGGHIGEWQPCFLLRSYWLSSKHPRNCQKQTKTDLTAKIKNGHWLSPLKFTESVAQRNKSDPPCTTWPCPSRYGAWIFTAAPWLTFPIIYLHSENVEGLWNTQKPFNSYNGHGEIWDT